MAPYKLLVLENPLLDIQAEGDDALLQKYGLKPNDAILAESQHMSLYSDLFSRSAKVIAGGAAQNSARGAQYLLPPHSVLYLGAVGTDDAAAQLDSACAQADLDTAYLRLADHPTGRCGVVITGHNRSMCTDLAAANHYRLDHLQSPEVWRHAAEAGGFYVGGYHLTVCPPAAEALGAEAAKRGVPFAFGMGAPFIPQFFGEPLGKLLPYCDFVFQNETEAEAWGTGQGMGEADAKDVKKVAQAMAVLPKANKARQRVVIVSQGTLPTVVAIAPGDAEMDASKAEVKEFAVHKIDEKEINDTNGAGDAFAGGFLAGLAQGKNLETCIDMGQWLAKISLTQLGPSYPFPKQTYTPTSAN